MSWSGARTGGVAFEKITGQTAFEYVAGDPALGKIFTGAMAENARRRRPGTRS